MNYKEELAGYELDLVVDGITEEQMRSVKGGINCLHSTVCNGRMNCLIYHCNEYKNCKLIGARSKCVDYTKMPLSKTLTSSFNEG